MALNLPPHHALITGSWKNFLFPKHSPRFVDARRSQLFLPEAESPRGLGTPTGWLLLGFALALNLNYSFAYPKETTTARFPCVSKINLCVFFQCWSCRNWDWLCFVLPRPPSFSAAGFNAQTPQTHLACDFHITGTPLCPPHPGITLAQDHGANNHNPPCPRCCLSLRWILLPFPRVPALTISLLNPFPSVPLTLPPHPSPSSACGYSHLCCILSGVSPDFGKTT